MTIDIGQALDDWAASIATTTGYTVTRDPDLVHPPCVYIDLPSLITPTLASIGVEIPVFVVGEGSGKQAGDSLFAMLPAVLDAVGIGLAEPSTLTLGTVPFQTYKIVVPATLIEDATPPGPEVPSAPGTPYADNWIQTGGGWQYDLHWALSSDDGGSPITSYRVTQNDGNPTIVNGNTGTLGAQFSLTFPVEVYVKAVNAAGVGPASPTASINPPV